VESSDESEDDDDDNNISAVFHKIAVRKAVVNGKKPARPETSDHEANPRSTQMYKFGRGDANFKGLKFPNFVAVANERQQKSDSTKRSFSSKDLETRPGTGTRKRPLLVNDDDDDDEKEDGNLRSRRRKRRKATDPSDRGRENRPRSTEGDKLSRKNLLRIKDIEDSGDSDLAEEGSHKSRSHRRSEKKRLRKRKERPASRADAQIHGRQKTVDREIANAIRHAPITAAPKAHAEIAKIKNVVDKARSNPLNRPNLGLKEATSLYRAFEVARKGPENKTEVQHISTAARPLVAGRGGTLTNAKHLHEFPRHLGTTSKPDQPLQRPVALHKPVVLPKPVVLQKPAASSQPRAPPPPILPKARNIFHTGPKKNTSRPNAPAKLPKTQLQEQHREPHQPKQPQQPQPKRQLRQGLPAEDILSPDSVILQWVVCRTPKFIPQGCETKHSKAIRGIEYKTLGAANSQAKIQVDRLQKGAIGKSWNYFSNNPQKTIVSEGDGLFEGQVKFEGGEVQFFWVEEVMRDLSMVTESRRALRKPALLVDPVAAQVYQRSRYDVWSYHIYTAEKDDDDDDEEGKLADEVKNRPGMQSQIAVIDCSGDSSDQEDSDDNVEEVEIDDDGGTLRNESTQSDGEDIWALPNPSPNPLDMITPRMANHGSFTTLELANRAALRIFLKLAKPRDDQPEEDNHFYKYYVLPRYTEVAEEMIANGTHSTRYMEIEWDPDYTKYKWNFLRLVVQVGEVELKGPMDISDMLADELLPSEASSSTASAVQTVEDTTRALLPTAGGDAGPATNSATTRASAMVASAIGAQPTGAVAKGVPEKVTPLHSKPQASPLTQTHRILLPPWLRRPLQRSRSLLHRPIAPIRLISRCQSPPNQRVRPPRKGRYSTLSPLARTSTPNPTPAKRSNQLTSRRPTNSSQHRHTGKKGICLQQFMPLFNMERPLFTEGGNCSMEPRPSTYENMLISVSFDMFCH